MKSKYKEVRVDGKRYLTHRYVWEQTYGPIPKGYEVHHIDKDPYNNDLSNLELLPISEHRRLHSKQQTGRVLSEDTKNKIRIAHIGTKASDVTRKKMSESYGRKIPVTCVELNKIFDTIQDAAEFINRDRSGIYSCIHDKQKTSGGYHWKKATIDNTKE